MIKKKVLLLNCKNCGTPFFTESEKTFYESHHLCMPKRCKKCRTNNKRELDKMPTTETDRTWNAKENLEIHRLIQIFPYFDLFETTSNNVSHYYEATERNSKEIIRKNQHYFKI